MRAYLLLFLALALSQGAVKSYAEETNAMTPGPKRIISVEVNGTTGSKTTVVETSDSNKAFAAGFVTNLEKYTSFVDGKTNVPPELNNAVEVVRTNLFPTLIETGEAMDLFIEMKNKGQVPGVAKDGHGNVTSTLNLPLSSEKLPIERPATVTINVVLTGDSLTNHYTFGRASKDATLRLQKAWRTDSKGLPIKEWPVD